LRLLWRQSIIRPQSRRIDEVSSCFLTRIVGLTRYRGHEQCAKAGSSDCVEIGARNQARLPTFQVDRSTLNAHLFESAQQADCEILRHAKVSRCELDAAEAHSLGDLNLLFKRNARPRLRRNDEVLQPAANRAREKPNRARLLRSKELRLARTRRRARARYSAPQIDPERCAALVESGTAESALSFR
jgi:hypothetical protein